MDLLPGPLNVTPSLDVLHRAPTLRAMPKAPMSSAPPGLRPACRILTHTLLNLTPAQRCALDPIDAVLLGLAVFRALHPTPENLTVSGAADRVNVQFVPQLKDDVVAALHEAGWKNDQNDASDHPSNTWWRE